MTIAEAINSIADKIKPKKSEPKMKTFKQIVERIVEEANQTLRTPIKIKEDTLANSVRIRLVDSQFESKENKAILLTIEKEGTSPGDKEKAYGQLLKEIASRGILFTKEKFDNGTWGR